MEAKATVTSLAGPLYECHTLTLLMTMTAAELTSCLAGGPIGGNEGLDVVGVDSDDGRELAGVVQGVEAPDPLSEGLSA